MAVEWEVAWKIALALISVIGGLSRIPHVRRAFWTTIYVIRAFLHPRRLLISQALYINDLEQELEDLVSHIEDRKARAIRAASDDGSRNVLESQRENKSGSKKPDGSTGESPKPRKMLISLDDSQRPVIHVASSMNPSSPTSRLTAGDPRHDDPQTTSTEDVEPDYS